MRIDDGLPHNADAPARIRCDFGGISSPEARTRLTTASLQEPRWRTWEAGPAPSHYGELAASTSNEIGKAPRRSGSSSPGSADRTGIPPLRYRNVGGRVGNGS
jgi:hypothetical protein